MADERKKKEKEKEKPRVIAPPDIWADCDEGKGIISIYLGYEGGAPVPGADVRLIIKKKGAQPEPVDIRTNSGGFAQHPLDFMESSCDITVQAGGRQEQITLWGPGQTKKSPVVPDVPERINKRGFRARFFWYSKQVRKLKQKKASQPFARVGRLYFRFRTNNNARLYVAWLVFFCLITAGMFIVGFNTKEIVASNLSARELSYIRHANPDYGIAKTSWLVSSFRTYYWWFTIIWFIGSFFYIFVAYSDEVKRTIYSAGRRLRERRGGEGGGNEPRPANPLPLGEQNWYGTIRGQAYVIIREIFGSGFADIFTRMLTGRRRG